MKKFICIKDFSITVYNPDRKEVGFQCGKIYNGKHFFKEAPPVYKDNGISGISGWSGVYSDNPIFSNTKISDTGITGITTGVTYDSSYHYRGGRNGYIMDSENYKCYFGYSNECDEHFAAVEHLDSYFKEFKNNEQI